MGIHFSRSVNMSKEKKPKEKTNKRTNKIFFTTLAGLLCFVIACSAANGIVDNAAGNAAPAADNQQSAGINAGQQTYTPQSGGNVSGQQTDTPAADNTGAPVQSDSQQTAVPNNTPVSGGNTSGGTAGGNSGAAANSSDPLSFNTAQLINYYNTALRKTYSQPKFNVTKTEVIDVQLGEMLLNGKPATGIQGLANKVVASNAAKGGTKKKSYTSGNVVVDARERFILPTNLTSAGVRSGNIAKSGAGYVINFTLKEERCDFRTKPPYNASCTFPLDFTEIDLGGIGQITSAQFYYPGTTLQAQIDGQGRVVKTYVVMPLTVDNASGTGMGQTLNVDISGKWLCTNVFSF